MTDHGRRPQRWAIDLNTILAAFAGDARFPVPVEQLANDFSRQRFPDSPIVDVAGRSLGKFEGALYPVRGNTAWAIIYNSRVSDGRRRFTIGHEFGHYLMHRSLLPPEGIECGEDVVTFRAGDDLEKEADTFAAYLLMPFDDFRLQLPSDIEPSLEDMSALADRYGVSLISCVLRWLEYTQRRSMIVISRDGYILWSWSSQPAFKSGLFFRTRSPAPPVAVPANSLIGRRDHEDIAREGVDHPPGVWFDEDCTEITVHSDKYDQSVTILHFANAAPRSVDLEEPVDEDTFDRFTPKPRERLE